MKKLRKEKDTTFVVPFSWRGAMRLERIQNGGDLFQAQSVLLNGKRTIDGADAVATAQIGIAGKMIVRGKPSGQL